MTEKQKQKKLCETSYNGINVLSLFNGCGMLRPALDKAGITVNNYFSSEIDKYANVIAQKNYPDTIQLGDICHWQSWDLPKIDFLTGGFPCQDLSVAGKQKGLQGNRSSLLFQALSIRDAINPTYFLFENVASMSHYWRDEITKLIGVEPVKLNSKYWGAQNRSRLFWTNIPNVKDIELTQEKNDRKIYLKDILLDGAVISTEKQLHIIKQDKLKHNVVNDSLQKIAYLGNNSQGQRIYDKNGKSPTLSASGGGLGGKTGMIFACLTPERIKKRQNGPRFKGDGKMFTLTAQDRHGVYETNIGIRKLHPIECERLMNLPDSYTEGVSNTQRYKMLGNGWDVAVITDLLCKII